MQRRELPGDTLKQEWAVHLRTALSQAVLSANAHKPFPNPRAPYSLGVLLRFVDTSPLVLTALFASFHFSSCLCPARVNSSMDSSYLPFNSKVGHLREALNSACNIYRDIPTIITGHIMKGMEK